MSNPPYDPSARYCPGCGAPAGEEARFCRTCGRELPPMPPPQYSMQYQAPCPPPYQPRYQPEYAPIPEYDAPEETPAGTGPALAGLFIGLISFLPLLLAAMFLPSTGINLLLACLLCLAMSIIGTVLSHKGKRGFARVVCVFGMIISITMIVIWSILLLVAGIGLALGTTLIGLQDFIG